MARSAEEKSTTKVAKSKAEEVANPLDLLRKKVNSTVGYEAVEFASASRYNRGKIPSGILPADIMLRGGVKVGATHEVFGQPGVGKTWWVYRMLAQFQKSFEKPVGFVDLEKTFDPIFARTAGLNVDDNALLLAQVQSGGDAIDIMEMLVRDAGVCAIAMDSVAALATKAELEKRGDQDTMGTQAKLMSAALRKLTTVNNQGITVFFLNQMRDKIGGFGGSVSSGGRALRYYATTSIEFRKGPQIVAAGQVWDDERKQLVDKEIGVGHFVQMNLKKTKCGAREGDTASWKFWYVDAPGRGVGYSELDELMILGLRYGLMSKAAGGGWYSWKDDVFPKCQGDNQLWQFINNSPEAQQHLRALADSLMGAFSEG